MVALARQVVRSAWTRSQRSALNLTYPRICFGCDALLDSREAAEPALDTWLCQPCRDGLAEIQPPQCGRCGEPFSGDLRYDFTCWNCDGRQLAFDFATSGYRADGVVRELIHGFKYERRFELRGVLTQLLRRALADVRLAAEDLSSWLLVPVPLHPWREWWREYNQSWELCVELSRVTGIPAARLLRRTRRTTAQAGLNRARRIQNLHGAFALASPPRLQNRPPSAQGRRILLVDDVLTTGSTAHECARVLRREGGAEKVVVITAARG
jgi:ComF family protein